jgi:L-lactate dehydrogenase complex protein LldF
MYTTPQKTKKYIKKALADNLLRTAVDKATSSSLLTRKILVDQMPYWEELRLKAHAIKKDVMENLAEYLEIFESNCNQNGITVHWASDEHEARDIILKLCQDNHVKKIVKSKSLTTEEIHLNDTLIKNNITTLETDLGEYIVQLNEQIPSHLIIPAMHLSRGDVGKLFAEKLGVPYTEDPIELLRIARARLRENFLTADMGISGANFGIAKSGCFCIVENEANAHLTISLPRIHVAVMGIEKLIPDIQSLPYFLKLLPVSATSQKSSTYVNFVGGVPNNRYGEGPESVHIILLDNGRSEILNDPHLRETLFCIRCGACLNACPVYQLTGGHAYGWVYMGPIGITLIPQFLGEVEGKHAPYLSSLCGACFEACPMRINIPHHLLNLRNRVVEKNQTKKIEKMVMSIWAYAINRPKLYRLLSQIPAKLQQLLPKNVSFPAPGYTKERALGRFDAKGFRKRFIEMD